MPHTRKSHTKQTIPKFSPVSHRVAGRRADQPTVALSSAPWRTGEAAEDDEADRLAREGKVSVTSNPGETPTMHVPRKRQDLDLAVDDFDEDEIDPELRYSFQRNSRFLRRVFSVDTLVKPLPPVMAYSVSRNVNFFFKIFTQFWGAHIGPEPTTDRFVVVIPQFTAGKPCVFLSHRRALRAPSPAGEPCALPLLPASPARSLSRRRSLRASSPAGEPCALLSRRLGLRAPSPPGDVCAPPLPPVTSACSLSRRARVELSAGETLSRRRLGVYCGVWRGFSAVEPWRYSSNTNQDKTIISQDYGTK
ncbi:hypothetical protein GUJ93_ZPchr0006g42372 [Zizania palustris]|uniref:Uncharacterized protein n=1 Tax=Zizania palustris TaxID=103762 RepID=A0A8J5VSY4_ZIZPA|nr:hypothetical protein GUJ93_ZPchr0006g42372 [Zizania palustris]